MAPERDPSLAFVFPGQGAQRPDMFSAFAENEDFHDISRMLEDHLELDPRQAAAWAPDIWRRNIVSSLMTAAASVLLLRRWRRENRPEPAAVAGYSVGQWTALHAAGALNDERLFSIIAARARLMDAALADRPASGMLAVIGLRIEEADAICAALRSEGRFLQVANDNAPGQFTLSGEISALEIAQEALSARRPKKLLRLEAAGAWHSDWMRPAVAPLRKLIAVEPLAPTDRPAIDNTTGRFFEGDPKAALAEHAAAPVLWRQGVRTLIENGAATIVEVGYGAMLSQFGAFISRDVRHLPLHPSAPKVTG